MSNPPEVRQVFLDDLRIDETFQRRIDWNRVGRLAESFVDDAVGVVTVSLRDNGGLYLVDGQHRVQAALKAGRDKNTYTVQARVFEGMSHAEEAELFRLLNNAERVPAFDKFRARIIEGDEVALTLLAELTRNGFALRYAGKSIGSFSAVAALEWVYAGASVTEETPNTRGVADLLYVAGNAFDHKPAGVGPNLVRGIGMFVTRHRDQINLDRLIQKIREYGDARKLVQEAKSAYVPGNTKFIQANAVAAVLTDVYNKHLQNKDRRLPPWRSVK